MKDALKNHGRRLLKDIKSLLIVGLLLIIVIIIVLSSGFRGQTSFKIEDKCGRFVNLISHTIADEEICKSRCRGQCQSMNRNYQKIEFEESNNACNSCLCYCR